MTAAERIWDWVKAQGPRGVTADEVLARFSDLGHTTVTARLRGLKQSDLLSRHPESLVRKTRSGRRAEVWVARGKKFAYQERKKLPAAQNVAESATGGQPCNLPHVTEAEVHLLAICREYTEVPAEQDRRIDEVLNRLFHTILKVYPPKKATP